jgi:hypothetical protein
MVTMRTTPVDSVLGTPEYAYDRQPGPSMSDFANHQDVTAAERTAAPSTEVEQVNSELLTIASTIEELQGRLEQANARLASAASVETTEYELGRLFVEAQRFSEASLSTLEVKVHEILGEAEAKAKQILTEATEEAHEIRRQAQQSAFASTTSVRELQSAIAGFTVVNAELLKELGALNATLVPNSEKNLSAGVSSEGEGGMTEIQSSSGMSERD